MLIAFDLDGTLVDSQRDLAESANALLAFYGARPLEPPHIVGMVGEGAARLVERACTAAGLDPVPADALDRFLRIYDTRLLNHTRCYPGTEDMLRQAGRKATLAVLTNKPEAASRAILQGTGLLGFFGDVVGGDSQWGRKPEPAGLRWLLARAGAAPAEALMVGDSHVDLLVARAAGVRFCLARYGFGHASVGETGLDPEDFGIDRPTDLLRHL